MTQKPYGNIIDEQPTTLADWVRYVTKIRQEDIENADKQNLSLEGLAEDIAAITVPVKATGAEIDTGTDDVKFVTAKALNDSHNIVDVAPGTSGNIPQSNGTDWVSQAMVLPVGSVIQCLTGSYATNADITTAVPADDTIPQNNEGDEITTVAITPRSVTNRLRVQVSGFLANSSAGNVVNTLAVFKDSTADALYAWGVTTSVANALSGFSFHFEYVPGSVSATTLKLRAGPASSTLRLNGTTAARRYGGVANTVMTVTEIMT